jgi:hypothetical protein
MFCPFFPQSIFTKMACMSCPSKCRFSVATFLLNFTRVSCSSGSCFWPGGYWTLIGSISNRCRHSSSASTLFVSPALLNSDSLTACGGISDTRSSHRYRRIDSFFCVFWAGSLPTLSLENKKKGMERGYFIGSISVKIFEVEGSHEIIIMAVCELECTLVLCVLANFSAVLRRWRGRCPRAVGWFPTSTI